MLVSLKYTDRRRTVYLDAMRFEDLNLTATPEQEKRIKSELNDYNRLPKEKQKFNFEDYRDDVPELINRLNRFTIDVLNGEEFILDEEKRRAVINNRRQDYRDRLLSTVEKLIDSSSKKHLKAEILKEWDLTVVDHTSGATDYYYKFMTIPSWSLDWQQYLKRCQRKGVNYEEDKTYPLFKSGDLFTYYVGHELSHIVTFLENQENWQWGKDGHNSMFYKTFRDIVPRELWHIEQFFFPDYSHHLDPVMKFENYCTSKGDTKNKI